MDDLVETPTQRDGAAPIFTPSKIEPTILLDDASEPIPDFIMTPGDDAEIDLDPIADRASEIGKCLGADRTCIVLVHARGAITAALPEEDDDAGQCIVAALEGARLDEKAIPSFRVCITRTRR